MVQGLLSVVQSREQVSAAPENTFLALVNHLIVVLRIFVVLGLALLSTLVYFY